MKYRTAGLLSLGLTAVASLTLYSTPSTSAQPPLGSVSSNSHDHDHDHDGHDHSHPQSSQSSAPSADAIAAPSGGPPPLPTGTPTPSTNQRGDSQSESASPLPADLPPTLLPPDSRGGNGFQPQNYDCPNVRQRGSYSHRDVCPLDVTDHASSFESCDHQFAMPYTELTHYSRPSSYQYGMSRDYGVHEYRASFESPEPCYQRFSHEPYGHGPTYHGH
jgi:hypothetical protein